MEYTTVHQVEIAPVFLQKMFPDGGVPWREATPPDLENGDDKRNTGSLRACSYCGSMHPADVAEAIRAGAHGSWADRKYGWPHKAYFEDVPNPHAGMLESRGSANYKAYDNWIQVGERQWREPGTPAPATTRGKFYSVHLMDATPEDRELIERHLGLHFEFTDDGKVSWCSID